MPPIFSCLRLALTQLELLDMFALHSSPQYIRPAQVYCRQQEDSCKHHIQLQGLCSCTKRYQPHQWGFRFLTRKLESLISWPVSGEDEGDRYRLTEEIKAERIVLSSVCGLCSVQSNCFMPNYIVTWSNRRRNDDCPSVIVCDHNIRSPIAACDLCRINESNCINLKPLHTQKLANVHLNYRFNFSLVYTSEKVPNSCE